MGSAKRKADAAPSKERNGKRSKPAATETPVVPEPTSTIFAEGEAFRRGGAELLTPLEKKQIRAQANQDALFEEETGEKMEGLIDSDGEAIEAEDLPATKQRGSKMKRLSSEKPGTKIPKVNKIDGLSFKRISKGMMVLGCVSRIGRKDITLALPNNLTGFVPLASISAAIRKQIEEREQESSGEEIDAPPAQIINLADYVRIGQYLRAVVISTGEDSKKRILLSTVAKDVNRGVKIEELTKGITLQGEVASIEDRGAILDLGLSTGKAKDFISSTELGDLQLKSLQVGSPILCSVTSSTTNNEVVKVSASSKYMDGSNVVKTISDVNSLLPGTAIEVVVSETNEGGFRGTIMNLVDVTADVVHSGLFFTATTPKIGKKVKARIIYKSVGDDSQSVGVSLLPHILSVSQPKSSDLDGSTSATDLLSIASIVEEMKVTKVDGSRGLLLDVGVKGVPGFAHISRISDKKVKELSSETGTWQIGSTHRGRIIGYNAIDGVFLVSLEESVLELPFLSYDDAKPGQLVEGIVTKYKSRNGEIRGIVLKVTDSVSGLVPAVHLSTVQLSFPERKFKMDSVVKARVLSVDHDRRRMTLTCKKPLLNSENSIWASYSDVHVGSKGFGTIVAFLPSGALVEFYGQLKGFLPTSEMSESFIRDPKEHFHIGQVVNLRALTVNATEKRLVVSCREKVENTDASEQLLERLHIGSIVSGKISEKLADEFVLDLEGTGVKATISFAHLVDGSEQKCARAAKRLQVEQTLQDLAVLILNKNKRYIRLTNRPSLVQALRSGIMPSTIDKLETNMEVVGAVKNITAIGVFVQFANSLTGLLPKAQLADGPSEQSDFGFKKGQTISCRVLSVDLDQQRFFLTQKESKLETEPASKQYGSTHSATTVSNPVDGTSTAFTLGQLTKAKITAVKDTQLNVKLADGVQGRIDISQIFDDWDRIKNKSHPLRSFQNGQTVDVKVLGLHDARNHKTLAITHRRGHAVFELSAKPSDQVPDTAPRLTLADIKIGEKYLGFVNNVGRDHLWVNISTEIRGRVNAVELTDNADEIADLSKHYPVGCALQTRVIQINAVENRLDLSARPVDRARPQVFEDLKIGQIVVGRISKSYEKLVIVKISDQISGAVHICDLADDFSKASIKDLQLHQTISAAVVGLDQEKKTIQLSIRPSKLGKNVEDIVDSELHSIQDINVNDTRRGFVKNITDKGLFVWLSRSLTAFIPVAELSDQFIKIWKDKFTLHQLVRGKVIAVKEADEQIKMSLKGSIIDSDFSAPLTFDDLKVGHIYNGRVRKVEDFGVFVLLDKSQNVSGLCHRSQIADVPVSSVKDLYQEGNDVKVKILKVDKETKRVNLGMKASYFEDEMIENESEQDEEDTNPGEVLSDDEEIESDDGGVTIQTNSGMLVTDDAAPTAKLRSKSKSTAAFDLGGFDFTGTTLDDSEDQDMLDVDDTLTKPKSKRHGGATIQIDRTGDLDTHGAQSSSDFERLLLGQSNSSDLWIRYISFHLRLSELDKAREIAERALRTINGESKSTQDEALNVWIAYLNLENLYGDDASIEEVFKRACIRNEPKEVYTSLTNSYVQSGKLDVWSNFCLFINANKLQKATNLYQDMIKRFSPDPTIWQKYAYFLFNDVGDAARGRELLDRALHALPQHQKIEMYVKFAQLEFKSAQGDNERGRSIFEELIRQYPKRLDIWNILLDLEIRAGSKDQIRRLFDRVTASKIKVHKAKFFFKKWLEYEEKEGDVKSQEKVKAKAAEFVRRHEEAKA